MFYLVIMKMFFDSMIRLISAINFPSVILLFILFFRKNIQILLDTVINFIRTVREIKYKDFELKLLESNVSNETKRDFLTIHQALTALADLKNEFRDFIPIVSSQFKGGSSFWEPLKKFKLKIRLLVDALEMIPESEDINQKIALLKKIINILDKTKDQSVYSQAYPSINALGELESDWKDKDPDDFTFFQELASILKKYSN